LNGVRVYFRRSEEQSSLEAIVFVVVTLVECVLDIRLSRKRETGCLRLNMDVMREYSILV
jgi:hypothetical protein